LAIIPAFNKIYGTKKERRANAVRPYEKGEARRQERGRAAGQKRDGEEGGAGGRTVGRRHDRGGRRDSRRLAA